MSDQRDRKAGARSERARAFACRPMLMNNVGTNIEQVSG